MLLQELSHTRAVSHPTGKNLRRFLPHASEHGDGPLNDSQVQPHGDVFWAFAAPVATICFTPIPSMSFSHWPRGSKVVAAFTCRTRLAPLNTTSSMERDPMSVPATLPRSFIFYSCARTQYAVGYTPGQVEVNNDPIGHLSSKESKQVVLMAIRF
jgi:hypothetical protein